MKAAMFDHYNDPFFATDEDAELALDIVVYSPECQRNAEGAPPGIRRLHTLLRECPLKARAWEALDALPPGPAAAVLR